MSYRIFLNIVKKSVEMAKNTYIAAKNGVFVPQRYDNPSFVNYIGRYGEILMSAKLKIWKKETKRGRYDNSGLKSLILLSS